MKLTQLTILSLIATYEQNSIVFIGALLISLLTHQKHWISSLMGMGLIAITLFQGVEVWKFALMLLVGILALFSVKISMDQRLDVRYLLPAFLVAMSVISIN